MNYSVLQNVAILDVTIESKSPKEIAEAINVIYTAHADTRIAFIAVKYENTYNMFDDKQDAVAYIISNL